MTDMTGFAETPEQETTGRTVVGLFRDRAHAETAIRDLKTAGFSDDRVGVAMQDAAAVRDPREGPAVEATEAVEGAATGAVSGGLVGGLIGLLGSLLIPGLGPIVVGGVLASTLTGLGIGAATGGLLGSLVALGVPEDDARHFDSGLRSGGALVTVNAGARTGEALSILQRHEADFGPTGARRFEGLDWSARDNSMPTATAAVTPVSYVGEERRFQDDPAYVGPERRLAGV